MSRDNYNREDIGKHGIVKTRAKFERDYAKGLSIEEMRKKYGKMPYWFNGQTSMICPAHSHFKPDFIDERKIRYQWLEHGSTPSEEIFAFDLPDTKKGIERQTLLDWLSGFNEITFNGQTYRIFGFPAYFGRKRPATGRITTLRV